MTIEPGKSGGKLCIRGVRITIYDIRHIGLPRFRYDDTLDLRRLSLLNQRRYTCVPSIRRRPRKTHDGYLRMKLLFDQNLSLKLTIALQDLLPGSEHVYNIGLAEVDDRAIWKYACIHDFVIVTKDVDYSDLSTLLGAPPSVLWIRRGNCQTKDIAQLLRQYYGDIHRLTFRLAFLVLV